MALDLTTVYPGKIDGTDPDYPYGKAQNITNPGDGTGTPWEQQIVNDWLGFFQALLTQASPAVVPSGAPDDATTSQYLTALKNIVSANGPIGTISSIGAGAIPNGWLECDGSEISRATYAELFAQIGTKFGVGDGSTTFNLPNGPRSTFLLDGAFTDVAPNFTQSHIRTKFSQDLLGNWFMQAWVHGTVRFSTFNPAVAVYGIGSFDGITALAGPGSYPMTGTLSSTGSSAFRVLQLAAGNNIQQLTVANIGPDETFGGYIDFPLNAKPTDLVVGSDVRFGTFDQAIQNKPIIRAVI